MIPKHIIELAVKGGYNVLFRAGVWGYESGEMPLWVTVSFEQMILNPLFWQSLGRELGWVSNWGEGVNNDNPNHWFQFAHLYFDLRMTNGDTTTFWKSISDKK